MTDFVDQIEERIEAKHREAIHALHVLRSYLTECAVPEAEKATNGTATRIRTRPVRPEATGGSIRERVFSAISDWATVKEIVSATGLRSKQVRGVLNGADVRNRIERRSTPATGLTDGEMEYKLSEQEEVLG